ncbi:MAG TPA: hypothetical protein VGT98_06010 [Candidatus Elarobacter sp.]|nr:hypothetical protein [Candidatus Elarobacter sp.]
MYAITRRYNHATALIDAIIPRAQEVEELLKDVPGFVSYYAIRSGATLMTVSVFDEQGHADESTRRVREWVEKNLPKGAVPPPETSGGEVFVHFATEHART